jgi:hypothetical protein
MKATLAVRELVDARGWDVAEFARQAGLDEETAGRVYAGQPAELELADHGRISEALGVLPNEILADVEEAQPSAADAPAPRSIEAPAYYPPGEERDAQARDAQRSMRGSPETPGGGEVTGEQAGDRTRPLR